MALDLDILKEIRDDVRAVRAEVGGAMIAITALTTWRESLEKQDLEGRIRALETSKAMLIGWAAGAGAASGAIVGIVWKLVAK